MRAETDKEKLEAFFEALGNRVTGEGRIYPTGGATAVLLGWRSMTIDVDIKGDPKPPGFFEAIAALLRELVSFEHALDHRLSKNEGFLTR